MNYREHCFTEVYWSFNVKKNLMRHIFQSVKQSAHLSVKNCNRTLFFQLYIFNNFFRCRLWYESNEHDGTSSFGR